MTEGVSVGGAAAPRALWVGEWQVVVDQNRIVRGTRTVTLEPKAMALLAHLAGLPGKVVSRDELLDAVWPGVVVGDNTLTQAIAKLRKALGDTAREPAYIEAIAKRGYRLIAEVRTSGGAASLPCGPAATSLERPAANSPASSLKASIAAAAVAAVVLIVATLAWTSWRTKADAPQQRPAAVSAAIAPPADARLPTVVVEPFRSLGDDGAQVTLARALTADLVTDLSKVAGIRVVTASGRANDPANDPANGAKDMRTGAPPSPDHGATYRLGGTVQQEGDRLRLNVLLGDGSSGQAVWSTRLDRQARDLFAAQDEMVKGVLSVLPVKLSEAETRRLAQRQTRSIEAWRTFVRAQAALLVRSRTANAEARTLYWSAIDSDPGFARAYAGVAMTYALEFQLGWGRDPSAALARAAELSRTAIHMNPDLPEARWVHAFVRMHRREHEQALRELDDALRLNPSYADAYALEAGIQTYVGRPDDAVRLLRQALRLNPDAGSLYFLLLGRAYYFLGDPEQARVNLNEALARNAQSIEARLYLAATHAMAGDVASAQWQVEEVLVLDPGFGVRAWLASYPLTDQRQRERLQSALRALGLE